MLVHWLKHFEIAVYNHRNGTSAVDSVALNVADKTLIRIANYFNVSTDYLLGRDVPDESDHIRVSCIEVGDKRIALDDEDVKLHVNGAVVTIHVEAER